MSNLQSAISSQQSAVSDQDPVGVVLMSYGSPATVADVPAYLAHVRGGRPAPDELVREFQRRYAVIGGSPLLGITRQQAAALQQRLSAMYPAGPRFEIEVGMRHAPPFVAEAVASLETRGVRRIVGLILSPQHSPILMGGYREALCEAASGRRMDVAMVGPWHRQPLFVEALAQRVEEALQGLGHPQAHDIGVILTSHSLPRRVVDREPQYLEQLQETVRCLVERLELPNWQFAYQSAGHTPEEWLKPDLKELLPGLAAHGYRQVLVAPVQFVADHLETLYDLDVAARAEAEAAGMKFARTESLNCMPLFIQALAEVVAAEARNSHEQ